MRARAEAGEGFGRLDLAVLVVEDNPVNRKVTERWLDMFGCRHESVENGADAVAAVRARPFDAILMDCQMPVMDGYQATAAIRQTTKDCRIVALTADGNRDRCLEAGMDDFLPKPLRAKDLYEALSRPRVG